MVWRDSLRLTETDGCNHPRRYGHVEHLLLGHMPRLVASALGLSLDRCGPPAGPGSWLRELG